MGTYVEDHDWRHYASSNAFRRSKKVVHWCKRKKLAFYLETNSGVYCNDQMIKDGPAADLSRSR